MFSPSYLRSALVFVTTCLSYSVLCSEDRLIDYRRPITVHITCCTTVSPAKLKFTITSYKIQHAANRCVYAVIFRTEANGSFCADPNSSWVRKKVSELSGGTVQLPARKKGKKGAKGGKKGKPGRKQKNKNKKKPNNNKKIPVTSSWFPSTTVKTIQTTA